VGSFPGDAWSEWNGRFRDDVRSFFRADDRSVVSFADRILGSPQIYWRKTHPADKSVNFITSHDGFTLNDLVSYREKHNEANREGNRDGIADNRSSNWGHEGPTDDPFVERVRIRQIKNFVATTLLSTGVPMLLMGDEVRRTQRGNNNAYCQDNDMSWFDWTLVAQHAAIHRFVRLLIAGRTRQDPTFRLERPQHEVIRSAVTSWHGVKLERPDWSDVSHSIALRADRPDAKVSMYAIFNAYWQPLEFELARVGSGNGAWRRWIDTSLESPDDIVEWKDAPLINEEAYRAGPQSLVVLRAG
jgi:glycogen operon protein